MVQFMTSSYHGFWVTKKDKKNEDEKCASLTTLLGIIFLFFSFSQKACLNFEKKKLFFRLILKYSSFLYFSSRKVHFCGTGS